MSTVGNDNETIDLNFYFPANCSAIEDILNSTESPLELLNVEDDGITYHFKRFPKEEFDLMDNQEDWLYDDNALKNNTIAKYAITPQSVLFYQTQPTQVAAGLTERVAKYFVSQNMDFFLLGYNETSQDYERVFATSEDYDRLLFVNKSV